MAALWAAWSGGPGGLDHALETLRCLVDAREELGGIGDARADRYDAAISAVMTDENVDSVGVILTPQSMTDIDEIAEGIIADAERFEKTLYCSFMGEADVRSGVLKFLSHKIPHYILPEDMYKSLAVSTKFNETKQRIINAPPPPPLTTSDACKISFRNAAAAGKTGLTEIESLEFLKDSGLPMPARGQKIRPEICPGRFQISTGHEDHESGYSAQNGLRRRETEYKQHPGSGNGMG